MIDKKIIEAISEQAAAEYEQLPPEIQKIVCKYEAVAAMRNFNIAIIALEKRTPAQVVQQLEKWITNNVDFILNNCFNEPGDKIVNKE